MRRDLVILKRDNISHRGEVVESCPDETFKLIVWQHFGNLVETDTICKHCKKPLTCVSPPISTPGCNHHQFPFIYRPISTRPARVSSVFMPNFPALLCLCYSCPSCLVPGVWIFACSLGFVCLPGFDPCLILTPIKHLWTLKYLPVVVLLGSLPSEPLHLFIFLFIGN